VRALTATTTALLVVVLLAASPARATPAPAAARDTAKLVAKLGVFRRPMRHPRDEVVPFATTLAPADAAIAASADSRLIADTPVLTTWAVIVKGRLRVVTAPKLANFGLTSDSANDGRPASEFLATLSRVTGGFSMGVDTTTVILVADGTTNARVVRADGTTTKLRITRNAIVATTPTHARVFWTDARGRRHDSGDFGHFPVAAPPAS
jgi:hypothetical protein